MVRDRADNKFDEFKEKLFTTDARITANEILKNQYDVFVEKQEMLERQWHGYKEEVKQEFAKTKE
jgi:hypothetical protein